MPQAFFRKLSNIMFVAAVVAVPQNTFDSLYQPPYPILIICPSILDDERNLTTYKINPGIYGNILYKGTFDAALHIGDAMLF